MYWNKPRKISIVVDNDSWILPYALRLALLIEDRGDSVRLVRHHNEIMNGDIAFYLGCIHITPPDVLTKNSKNIVVHASNLPKGRGFAPVAWQILDGANEIPLCLLEMTEEVDAGPVIFRDHINLTGNELYNEWRDSLGLKIIELCLRYLDSKVIPEGIEQSGEPTKYPRRRKEDSELDIDKSIADQFDLLRVVDNENYPAFFDIRGCRYEIKIKKVSK